MDAVKMHRVRMAACVSEVHPEAVSLGAAQRRSGHLSVVRPRREEHAGGYFDLLVDCDDIELAQRLSRWQRRDAASVELRQIRRRIKTSRTQRAHHRML